MSFMTICIGFIGKAMMSTVSRFVSPKDVVVDLGMSQERYVQNNLKSQNLKYHFSRRDQVIARTQDGWRIAVGRKRLFLTEQYIDRRNELILICKDA